MNAPKLTPVALSGEYELLKNFLDVPRGFRTDGASIPSLLWPFLGSPFAPELVTAALVHDWSYRFGLPRKQSDDVFRSMMLDAGVNTTRAALLWLGVRAFGWVYWRKCQYGRGTAG